MNPQIIVSVMALFFLGSTTALSCYECTYDPWKTSNQENPVGANCDEYDVADVAKRDCPTSYTTPACYWKETCKY